MAQVMSCIQLLGSEVGHCYGTRSITNNLVINVIILKKIRAVDSLPSNWRHSLNVLNLLLFEVSVFIVALRLNTKETKK